MTFDEWLTLGIREGYCSRVVCVTHEGLPTSAEEDDLFEEGGDPCMHAVRIEPTQHRQAPWLPRS